MRLREAFAAAVQPDDAVARRAAMLAVTASLLADAEPQRVIDRYIVLERIGAGGMGVVYLAHDPQLRRNVAIKLVGGGQRHRDAWAREQARLLREGRALARLSHPNVVPIYDVGVLGEQVYLAMEFVAGETLADWLARARPPLRAVLEVFLAAGRGLAAAHAAGIVHRDFKPANVIVGADGRVRVLDFGLARSTEAVELPSAGEPEPAGPRPSSTITGTPAYMAPEQERGEVGPAADQFSFCVALHEALCGARPFAGATLEELHAAKRAGVPVSPRSSPRRLVRALKRGLSFEPADRWPALTDLLDELERCLARARWPWVAVAAVAALVGGAAATAAQPPAVDVAADCRRDAIIALAPAWDGTRRADVARAFAASGLGHAGDSWARVEGRLDAYAGRWTMMYAELCRTVATGGVPDELATLRTRCLARRRGELQALVQVFRTADAGVVERSVAAVAALPSVTDCTDDEALRVELSRPDDPTLASEVDRQRDALDAAVADEVAGRFESALRRVDAVLTAATRLGFRPLGAEALLRRASLQLAAGDYEAAEATFVAAQWELIATRQDRAAAFAGSTLVFLVGDLLARNADGERLAREAEALVDRSGRAPAAEFALQTSLGNLRMRTGDYAAARTHLERALTLASQTPEAESLQRATSLLNLANVLDAEGDYFTSCEVTREALEIRTRELGARHPDLGATLTNLGNCRMLTGDFAAAEAAHREALAIWRDAFDDRFERLAFPLAALGDLALQRGRLDEALHQFLAARELWSRRFGADYPSVAFMDERIAAALLARGELVPAQQAAERALAVWERSASQDPQGLGLTLVTLAELARARGEPARAQDLLARAFMTVSAAYGPEHLIPVTIEVLRADLAGSLGEPGVLPRLAWALAILEGSFGVDSPWLLEPLLALGEAQLTVGDAVVATTTAERAAALAEAVGAPIQGALAEFLAARAIVRADPAQAREAAARATAAAMQLQRLGAGRHLAHVASWRP